MKSNRLYYIWLSCAIKGSYDVYKELMDAFGSVYDVYSADSTMLEHLSGRVKNKIRALQDKSIDLAVKISDYCSSRGIDILTYEDERYPTLLRDIEKPPIILYLRGEMPRFEQDLHVGIVGTRKMTDYGKCMAYNIGYSLARNGAVVVSGMALGNDSAAMCAALDAGGRCVGVLGSGVDIAYPPEHAGFLENIVLSGGAVISEYPPGTVPKPGFFIERNRIIAGLCRATVMVEGDMKSGAMHTARFTSKYGRTLFAVPGKVGEKASEGTLSLISDGARVVTEANDILKEYAFLYRGRIDLRTYPDLDTEEIDSRLYQRGVHKAKATGIVPRIQSIHDKKTIEFPKGPDPRVAFMNKSRDSEKEYTSKESERIKQSIESLPEDLRLIYDKLPKNEVFVSDDAVKYGISAQEFLYAVTILELKGLAVAFPGSRYRFLN